MVEIQYHFCSSVRINGKSRSRVGVGLSSRPCTVGMGGGERGKEERRRGVRDPRME